MESQCCICKSVRTDGIWGTPQGSPLQNVSHTYCPLCLKETLFQMKAELARANKVQPMTAA